MGKWCYVAYRVGQVHVPGRQVEYDDNDVEELGVEGLLAI